MPNRLDGKVAIVTGAASGFGRGIAELFAAEGAKVVVADIGGPGAERVASNLGANAIAAHVDVTKRADVAAMVATAVRDFGGLDILVNNAGAEIHEAAPHAVFVPRKGEVNAWDNTDFVRTVKETGRNTLVMAGVWTSVCVMFPALDAKAAGFRVYAVMDASGDPSEFTSRVTLARFTQAGVIPTSVTGVLCETHRTWKRPEVAELAKLYALIAPNYGAVIESYQRAQDVIKQAK